MQTTHILTNVQNIYVILVICNANPWKCHRGGDCPLSGVLWRRGLLLAGCRMTSDFHWCYKFSWTQKDDKRRGGFPGVARARSNNSTSSVLIKIFFQILRCNDKKATWQTALFSAWSIRGGGIMPTLRFSKIIPINNNAHHYVPESSLSRWRKRSISSYRFNESWRKCSTNEM